MTRVRAYIRSFTGFERDARFFLLTALLAGAAFSLYWIDFNLYLAALGMDRASIGLVAMVGSVAAAGVAFPASWLSDRIGRRRVLAAGLVLMALAFGGFAITSATVAIVLLVAAYNAGQQTFLVVSNPFLTEHSSPEDRSELFAIVYAIENVTNIAAALVGGVIAQAVASMEGPHNEAEPFRVLLLLMMVVVLVALASVFLLGDDRPGRTAPERVAPKPAADPVAAEGGLRARSEPAVRSSAAFPGDAFAEEPTAAPARGQRRLRLRLHVRNPGLFVRLLLPGFLISVGAGQVIPFLNLFIKGKFGLDIGELNAVFAFTSLGTVIAILMQPALARRMGKVASVAVVQAASIPFLVVLGFSPILWTVVLAMAVRNSLMNAGNPVFNAFAMERVGPAERATLSAAMSVLWSVGWLIAEPWYSLLQATLGFTMGYAVNFVTIIALYSTATWLMWHWFAAEERGAVRAAQAPGGIAARDGRAADGATASAVAAIGPSRGDETDGRHRGRIRVPGEGRSDLPGFAPDDAVEVPPELVPGALSNRPAQAGIGKAPAAR